MLVAPNHEVKPTGERLISNRVSGRIAINTLVPVLVKDQNVEEAFIDLIVLVHRPMESYRVALEGEVHAGVAYVSDAIKCNLSLAFNEYDWFNYDPLDVLHLAKVVQVAVCATLIHRAKQVEANW